MQLYIKDLRINAMMRFHRHKFLSHKFTELVFNIVYSLYAIEKR